MGDLSVLWKESLKDSPDHKGLSDAVQMQGKQLQERVYGECMSTCYDCACGKIIDNGVNRGFICGLGEKTFHVLFTAPTPEICDKFAKKSGISAWDAFNDEERKKYSEMYSALPSYNPDVSAEDFFRDMDSGYLGIYPENVPDVV